MKRIDYFFNLGSPWAYLGLDPFSEIATRRGAEIVPHVVPLIEENGGIYSRNRPPARRAYWTTDLKRWAHLRGVALQFEGRDRLSHPTPAARQIVAAHAQGLNWLELARNFHRSFWSEAKDIGDLSVRIAIADKAGFDGAALEEVALSDSIDGQLEKSRDLATQAGVFGVPTYLSDNQLFWGQDSLAFLDRHLAGERLTA